MKYIRLTLIFCLFCLTQPSYAQQELLDRIVAVVNEGVITSLELEQKIKALTDQLLSAGQPLPPPYLLRKSVLDKIIARKVQLQLAANTGIRVNDIDINETLTRLAEKNGLDLEGFKAEIEKEGVNFDEFRKQVREEMIIAQLRDREVNRYIQITDNEVERFLISEREQYFGENEYHVAHLLVKFLGDDSTDQLTERRLLAENLKQRLKQGELLSNILADEKLSEAVSGADLGWLKLNKLPRIFSRAVIEMRPKDISPVIESKRGFHIVLLVDSRQQTVAIQDKNIRQQAQRILFNNKVEERGQHWLEQIVDEAFIDKRI